MEPDRDPTPSASMRPTGIGRSGARRAARWPARPHLPAAGALLLVAALLACVADWLLARPIDAVQDEAIDATPLFALLPAQQHALRLPGSSLTRRIQGLGGIPDLVNGGSGFSVDRQVLLPVCAIALAAAGAWKRCRRPASAWLRQQGGPFKRLAAAVVVSAESSSTLEPVAPSSNPLQAFWKFLRPHTIRGTVLGSSVMVVRVLLEYGRAPDLTLVPKALCGVVALLCGNGYIVGINQIYDVSIDVINKPFLPVAAKELTVNQAWVLIGVMAVLGLGLSYSLFGPLIGGLYTFGLFLGTIYSVPPLRLKKSAVAAALIIATVRGVLLNFGVYYATRAAIGVPWSWSAPTAFMTCFGTIYALVIAVTKDLPDVQGDIENKIDTFATRMGVDKVAVIATGVLLANYSTALYWVLGPSRAAFRPGVLPIGHAVLASLLVRGLVRLRAAGHTQEALKTYYRLIWFLFYSEYFMFPFV